LTRPASDLPGTAGVARLEALLAISLPYHTILVAVKNIKFLSSCVFCLQTPYQYTYKPC